MKKKIIKLSITLVIILIISLIMYLIFNAIGLTDANKIKTWIIDLGAWAWVVCLLLQISVSILLCFIPATNMTFIILEVMLFGTTWQTFLLAFAGVILSSVGMDLMGRFGGSKLVIRLVGLDDYEKAGAIYSEVDKMCDDIVKKVKDFRKNFKTAAGWIEKARN